MFAVFGKASLESNRMDEIVGLQNSVAIPMALAQAGHVASYIAHSADGSRGASIYVFETKEQAEAFAASMKVPEGAPVKIESLEVFEVTAHG
jgi:hypothetical protein